MFVDMTDPHSVRYVNLVRTTHDYIPLLEDALHAVRHGRVGVAEEFIDRTIDALRKASQL